MRYTLTLLSIVFCLVAPLSTQAKTDDLLDAFDEEDAIDLKLVPPHYFSEDVMYNISEKIAEKRDSFPRQLKKPMTVMIGIERSGAIKFIKINESSGHKDLDMAIAKTIIQAGPFPPVPESYQPQHKELAFMYSMSPRQPN